VTLTRRKRDSDWMDEYRVGRDCPSDFTSEHEDEVPALQKGWNFKGTRKCK
jgi:hypothetical protein